MLKMWELQILRGKL